MEMGLLVCTGADLQRVFQNVERNIVAVRGVVVILILPRRLSGLENDAEIALARRLSLTLSRPPVERLLIVGPGATPVRLVAPRPEKIAQRFVSFRPDEIAF